MTDQLDLFANTNDDLPLFSGTPQRVREGTFNPLPEPNEIQFELPDIKECDLKDMSQCHGPLYQHGCSSNCNRCARHITLQSRWCNTPPHKDLIDWIRDGGEDLIPIDLYNVSRDWYPLDNEGKVHYEHTTD